MSSRTRTRCCCSFAPSATSDRRLIFRGDATRQDVRVASSRLGAEGRPCARFGLKSICFEQIFKGIFSLFFNGPATRPSLHCVAGPGCGIVPLERRSQECGMRRLISKFFADQSGATAIEYCLIAAGLSIVIVVAVNGLGSTLN